MIKVYGKPIRVNKASQDKKQQDIGANLFIGNLDSDVDEKARPRCPAPARPASPATDCGAHMQIVQGWHMWSEALTSGCARRSCCTTRSRRSG